MIAKMSATHDRPEQTIARRPLSPDEARELRTLLERAPVPDMFAPGADLRVGNLIARSVYRAPKPGWST